ncbi:hypothetical protein MRX96_018136 [Rhipicephalus microplus]
MVTQEDIPDKGHGSRTLGGCASQPLLCRPLPRQLLPGSKPLRLAKPLGEEGWTLGQPVGRCTLGLRPFGHGVLAQLARGHPRGYSRLGSWFPDPGWTGCSAPVLPASAKAAPPWLYAMATDQTLRRGRVDAGQGYLVSLDPRWSAPLGFPEQSHFGVRQRESDAPQLVIGSSHYTTKLIFVFMSRLLSCRVVPKEYSPDFARGSRNLGRRAAQPLFFRPLPKQLLRGSTPCDWPSP